MGPKDTGAYMLRGVGRASMPIVESRPKMPNTWSPWMCEMKMESIFIGDTPKRWSCICTPSPQSIKNERPRTESTWAL